MEHLTKQQIVLLTLFVSFVTSMATGIVTVSLMDQSSTGVTQTINRVVERTIERVVSSAPAETSTASVISYEDQVANNAEKINKSIVKIKKPGSNAESTIGLGIIVSNEAVILTDKAVIADNKEGLVARFYDGQEFPIYTVQSQINGDIVFLSVNIPKATLDNMGIVPISFASSLKLGQSVFSLSGKDGNALDQGIIEKTDGNDSSGALTLVSPIFTSINPASLELGSPLFTIYGEVIGIETSSFKNNSNNNKGIFYPINALRASIPVISR